ncbi:MAG: hypothetical protein QXD98_02230, partial [Candidatus Diapherotrites archaeon]
APKISLIPDKTFEFGVGPLYKIVDLWYYTNDETPDNLLSFSLLSQSNPNVVSCNILENRFVSCTKPLANEGTNTLTIKVTDQEGLSSFATFSIIIIRPQQYNTAPYFVKIEDMTISYPNTAIVADLRSKAYDAEDSFDNLSFSIISRSNSDFYCYIEKPYLKCYPTMPRSIGPTLIGLQVSDTQGATATTYFTLRGSNEYSRTPSLQGIPDLRIRENYSYTTRHVDLRNYVSDDNPVSELSFRVVSQSRSDIVYCRIANNYYFECDAPYRNKYGTSTIIVEVVDPQGNKDQDSFFVEVFPELTNSCNDIRVITYTVFMNGDERQVENFTIKNNSKYDFRITDVDLGEDSQYLRILDYDYDKKVLAYDETDLEVEFESDSTNYAREATGSIKIRGEFENGDVCSFSDIGTYYYRIRINPNYSSTSSTYCSDIKIITQDFSVNENSVNSKYFTLKNTSSRDFEITSISVSESSSYFNAKLERTFDEVSRYDEETFKITIESLGVSSTRTGEAEVRVSGRFSNGKYCSSSDIKKKFSVKVNDVATNVGTDNGANISITEPEIALSTSSISVFENQTKTINAIVKNKSNKTQCYRVSLNNSSRFTSSISNSNFCLSPNQNNTIDVRVSGRNAGSDNLELQLYYNNVDESIVNSKSRFVNIDILKEQKPQTTIVIDLKSSTITENKLSLINSGDELNNVRVSIVDLPEGLKFKEVSVSVWKKNEQLDLEIKESSVSGKFQASVLVESKEATRVVPIEFEIPKKEDFITGLGSLVVWPITFILIIIILILAVFGLLSVVSKK